MLPRGVRIPLGDASSETPLPRGVLTRAGASASASFGPLRPRAARAEDDAEVRERAEDADEVDAPLPPPRVRRARTGVTTGTGSLIVGGMCRSFGIFFKRERAGVCFPDERTPERRRFGFRCVGGGEGDAEGEDDVVEPRPKKSVGVLRRECAMMFSISVDFRRFLFTETFFFEFVWCLPLLSSDDKSSDAAQTLLPLSLCDTLRLFAPFRAACDAMSGRSENGKDLSPSRQRRFGVAL